MAPAKPPDGYWQEDACLPLRCDLSSGSWALPVVTSEEVIYGLPSDDYAKAELVDAEAPQHFVSFVKERHDGSRSGTWRGEPHVQLLVAARREINCWSSPDTNLGDALSALWPQLEHGYGLIPRRPSKQLPSWKSSFLTIALPADGDGAEENASPNHRRGSQGGGHGSGATSPFFSSDQYVPLF